MKAIIAICSLFLSVSHAGTRADAYNIICKPMTYDQDRENCLSKIRQYSYFEVGGLNICSTIVFDDGKIGCMDLIGNKVYEGYEIENCQNKTFESERLECLRASGTTYNPNRPSCVSREETIDNLSKSLKNLRAGNLKRADQQISSLLDRYTRCQ